MIPTEDQAKALWDTYHLPDQKRLHVSLVAKTARYLAKKLQEKRSDIHINESLLLAGALLHDIDKAVPPGAGERHPDTAVRILREQGMEEVADLVKTHPLQSILDSTITPKTWEEKLLYLADKMVKYDIVTVDKRFALWHREHLPPGEQLILDRSYPKVKLLEQEVFDLIHMSPEDLPRRVKADVAKLA